MRIAVASLLLCAACGPTHEAVWDQPKPAPKPPVAPPKPDAAALAHEAWTERGDRAALERAIELWEQVAAEDPSDQETLTRLSRAYFLLADGFMVPAGENGKSLDVYDRGITAGEQAMLAASPEFATRVQGGETVETALEAIPQAGQAAMYWYASNLGRFISADVTTAAMYKDRIHTVMHRLLELGPTFFYAGAHRYLGAFYAKAPAFLGGSLDKSKEHFEQALAIAPDYLDTKVLFAEYYAPKIKDRDMFERLLTEVVEADPAVLPDLEPEQRMAQRRAHELLANPDDHF